MDHAIAEAIEPGESGLLDNGLGEGGGAHGGQRSDGVPDEALGIAEAEFAGEELGEEGVAE